MSQSQSTADDFTTDEEPSSSSPRARVESLKDSKSKIDLYKFMHLEPEENVTSLFKSSQFFEEYDEAKLTVNIDKEPSVSQDSDKSSYKMKDLLRNRRKLLQEMIPKITYFVYVNYTSHKDSQLAVAAAAAAFKNMKRDKLSETTNEIIEKEESVDKTTLKTMFDEQDARIAKKMEAKLHTLLQKKSLGGTKTRRSTPGNPMVPIQEKGEERITLANQTKEAKNLIKGSL